MEAQVWIPILCTLAGAYIGFLTFSRNRDKDIKREASDSAVIQTKLDSISVSIESIKNDLGKYETRVNDLNDRIIRVEESAKQAHKRIDSIEMKGEI